MTDGAPPPRPRRSAESPPWALDPEVVTGLLRRGLEIDDLQRQLRWLRSPPAARSLVRPCCPGDGVRRLLPADCAALEGAAKEAAAGGRLSVFLPASGAASRMFEPLAAARAGAWSTVAEARDRARAGDRAAGDFLRVWEGLRRLALTDALESRLGPAAVERSLASPGDPRPLLEALLGPEAFGGVDAEQLPKGLLPFHLHRQDPADQPPAATPRTAFAEQLLEASSWVEDATGVTRVHATVAPGWEPRFEAEAQRISAQERRRFALELSVQDPATDTIALDAAGELARDETGAPLARPGGHGALLGNLEATRGDLVAIKNIDNVLPERRRAQVVLWRRRLAGLLAQLEERRRDLWRRFELESGSAPLEAARHWLAAEFSIVPRVTTGADDERARLRALIDRPIRVAGVVPNAGEPGGGPFWVRPGGDLARDAEAWPQIAESAEVDTSDPAQRSIWLAATHFNPVDLVCALRDPQGRPYELARYRDPEAVFVTHKSHRGQPLVTVERPGLWNGGMAGWLTVFVEVPAETFAPVKSILDLLRPDHAPGPAAGGATAADARHPSPGNGN